MKQITLKEMINVNGGMTKAELIEKIAQATDPIDPNNTQPPENDPKGN